MVDEDDFNSSTMASSRVVEFLNLVVGDDGDDDNDNDASFSDDENFGDVAERATDFFILSTLEYFRF